jgi:hypothetical protein
LISHFVSSGSDKRECKFYLAAPDKQADALINPPRPAPGKLMPQRLGFAGSKKRLPLDIANQSNYSKRASPILSTHQAKSSKAAGSNSKLLNDCLDC